MNDRDRKKLEKLHALMGSVPLPNVSTRTTSIRALVDYQAEMRVLLPAVRELTQIIAIGDSSKYRELVIKIEIWIKKRQAQDWQRPKLMPEIL